MDDEKKVNEDEVSLRLLPRFGVNKCKHKRILIDEELWCVECAICGELIDPIAWLAKIAAEEESYGWKIDKLRAIQKEIIGKTICKCEHCGKMTHIPHKEHLF